MRIFKRLSVKTANPARKYIFNRVGLFSATGRHLLDEEHGVSTALLLAAGHVAEVVAEHVVAEHQHEVAADV